MTTAYGNLSLYHSRHVYKRGQFKGDAPMAQRGKSHFRIIKPNPLFQDDPYLVRFWRTNIITAYPDGRIKLNCDGFETRPTTREALGIALHTCGFWSRPYSRRIGTLSQTAICVKGKMYRYYDGMEFDAEGTLLTPPQAWEAAVTDTDKTKAFRAQTKAFWDMFPVLFATRNKAHEFRTRIFNIANGFVGAPAASILDNPEHWPLVVSYYTTSYPDDQPKQARAHLMRMFTQRMNKLVDRGVE
jgi:hypothetical protein